MTVTTTEQNKNPPGPEKSFMKYYDQNANKVQKALNKFLCTRFDLHELELLCLELNIVYEELGEKTIGVKALSLVKYCHRHGEIFQLVKVLMDLRGKEKVDWPKELATPEEMLSQISTYPHKADTNASEWPDEKRERGPRIEDFQTTGLNFIDHSSSKFVQWLQISGFRTDPFPPASFHAEFDPFLNNFNPPAFWEISRFDELCGNTGERSFEYILGTSGSGKTCISRQIKRKFNESLAIMEADERKVLAVEYLGHKHCPEGTGADVHIQKIAKLIFLELEAICKLKPYGERIKVDEQDLATFQQLLGMDLGTTGLLKESIALCQQSGFDNICVLIDGITVGAKDYRLAGFNRIYSLVSRFDLLRQEGVLFKFLLPFELFDAYSNSLLFDSTLSYFEIKWGQDDLEKLLEQRVSFSLNPTERLSMPLLSNLYAICKADLGKEIVDTMLQFGLEQNSPRAMWKLGHSLFAKHMSQIDVEQLITRDTLERA